MTPLTGAARGGRTYRGATTAERAQARRARLIDAGIKVYGEVGYRQATVKAVCAAAGLTDRYFYEAFDNSEALLAACFETVTQDVFGILDRAAAAESGDDLSRGRAMLRALFEVLRRERHSARVFLVEMVGISDTIDRSFDAMLARVGDRMVETLDPNRAGLMAGDRLLARGVAAGLIGIATAWVRDDYAQPVEAATEAALVICALAAASSARMAGAA